MQPQQYQYPPQGYAPQPQQPPAQNGGALFVNPAAPGGGDIIAPKIYELDGCLVICEPTASRGRQGDNKTGYGKDDPRDRITTTITVLETRDGGPITSAGPNRTPPRRTWSARRRASSASGCPTPTSSRPWHPAASP